MWSLHMNVLRHMPKVAALVLFGWMGWTGYVYFFDKTTSEVSISGINQADYYAGDIQCAIRSNKSGEVSLWLDGKSLISSSKIKAQQDGNPFIIPTKTLSNGQHQLKVEFIDATYYKNRTMIERDFYVDNMPLQAAFVDIGSSAYKVFQG